MIKGILKVLTFVFVVISMLGMAIQVAVPEATHAYIPFPTGRGTAFNVMKVCWEYSNTSPFRNMYSNGQGVVFAESSEWGVRTVLVNASNLQNVIDIAYATKDGGNITTTQVFKDFEEFLTANGYNKVSRDDLTRMFPAMADALTASTLRAMWHLWGLMPSFALILVPVNFFSPLNMIDKVFFPTVSS